MCTHQYAEGFKLVVPDFLPSSILCFIVSESLTLVVPCLDMSFLVHFCHSPIYGPVIDWTQLLSLSISSVGDPNSRCCLLTSRCLAATLVSYSLLPAVWLVFHDHPFFTTMTSTDLKLDLKDISTCDYDSPSVLAVSVKLLD